MKPENLMQQQAERNTRDLVMMDTLSDVRRDIKIEYLLNSDLIKKSLENAFEKYNRKCSLKGIKDVKGADSVSKGKGLFYEILIPKYSKIGVLTSEIDLFGAVIFNSNPSDLYLYFTKQKENKEFGFVSSEAIHFPLSHYWEPVVPEVVKLLYSKDEDFKTEKDIKGSNFG